MPKSINEVRIAGHAGKDAVRYGNGPFKFSLATGGGKKQDGGEWPTQWHNVVVWPNRVEGAELVRKGVFVEVEGRLEYEKWTDKTTQQERVQAVVVAVSLNSGDGKQRPLTPKAASAPAPRPVTEADPITDDDIPF